MRVSSFSRHPHVLRPLRNLDLQQLFDREAVDQVVRHRAQVVNAVSERNHLLVELGLAGFLNAGMQKARCPA